MNHYEKYDIDDFVSDDFFCSWVLNPDEQKNIFWNNFKNTGSENKAKIEAAKKIVLQLNKTTSAALPEGLLGDTWSKINSETQPRSAKINWFKYAAAAAIALLVGFYVMNIPSGTEIKSPEIAETQNPNWIEYLNEGSSVERIVLDDGSIVTLEPQSRLGYPSKFDGKNRSVVIKGEGFFDIARDTTKPFYVYANETVIRVLGTSFFVKAQDEHKEVEVIVRTGKVEVFRRKDIRELQKIPTQKIRSLKVTPNQKVVFDREIEKMTRRITSTPRLVKPINELPRLRFEDASGIEIFDALAEAYGIDITFDKGTVADCSLTTTLNEKNLFEKLEIICEPLGLTYREVDAGIIISGNCR